MDFPELDCSTSSCNNSTNTGPIDKFFTKKCNYFSRATRRNHSFLSKLPLKGCFGTLKLSGHVHCPVLYIDKLSPSRFTNPWSKAFKYLKALCNVFSGYKRWFLYIIPFIFDIFQWNTFPPLSPFLDLGGLWIWQLKVCY